MAIAGQTTVHRAHALIAQWPGWLRQPAGKLLGITDALLALTLESTCLRGVVIPLSRAKTENENIGHWPVTLPSLTASSAPAETSAAISADQSALSSLTDAFSAASVTARIHAVVLGLPTSMFLLRILRLPLLSSEEMESAVALQMDKISPFPGDELAMGWEVLAEDDEHATVFASATPIRYLEMVGAALQQAGVRAFRLDVTLLAAWRALRNQGALAEGAGRQVVLFVHGDEWDILVLDEGLPVQARGIGRLVEEGDLTRELTLSIFQAEMEFGLRSLRDVLVVSDQPPTEKQLEAIRAATSVNVHFVAPTSGNTAADGLGLRHMEGAKLDMTPPTWRARERMEAVRRRMLLGLGLAAGLWVILAGTLFLGGVVTRQLTDIQKNRERTFIAEYEHVRDTRERVYLIDQYEDRSHSLLESLRTIVTQQPEGIELSSLTYRRDSGCKLTGEAPDPAPIYTFKERLQTTRPFTACKLGGVSIVAGSQRQRFELDAQFGEKSP